MKDFVINLGIKNFCVSLLDNEKLNLAGIDLLLSKNDIIYCFEVNPGPGWSAYHETDDIEEDTFLAHLMDCLRHGIIKD